MKLDYSKDSKIAFRGAEDVDSPLSLYLPFLGVLFPQAEDSKKLNGKLIQ